MKVRSRRLYISLGVVALLMVGCQKEELVIPESTDPVFKAEGTFDGQTFEMVAGDNDAYMHTMTEEENGVDVFSGMISDGETSLEIGIYDGNLDMPDHSILEELGNGIHYSESIPGNMLVLSQSVLENLGSTDNIASIAWYVDNDPLTDGVIDAPGRYGVRANIKFNDNTQRALYNDIIIGYDRHTDCSIAFDKTYVPGEGSAVIATIVGGTQTTVQDVKWYLDAEEVSDSGVFEQMISSDMHLLTAEIEMSNGAKRTRSVIIDGSPMGRDVYDFSVFEEMAVSASRDFNVRIRLEKDGMLYESEYADNSNSTLQVTNVEYYGTNNAGNDVYKITGTISANLFNKATQEVYPLILTTSFGIEIP